MTLVSNTLLADIRRTMREHPILVWLDRHDHYTAFVDDLATHAPFPVLAWRGSYLDLMMRLEHAAPGTEATPLLVHLPGFVEDDVRGTPLLELYASGTRYRIALDTLVKQAAGGHVPPAEIEAVIAQDDLTLQAADTWLAQRIVGGGTGLAGRIAPLTPIALLEFVRSGTDPDLPHQHLVVLSRLEALIGLPASWHGSEGLLGRAPRTAAEVLDVYVSWALAVEYVHDLRRPPQATALTPASRLPAPVIQHCREVARYLRTHASPDHTDLYVRIATRTELFLEEEVDAAQAKDLGKIDTFRFEEDKILEAAGHALDTEEWQAILDWAATRVEGDSIWLRRDPTRRSRWQLLAAAARLGGAIENAGRHLSADSHSAALERYTSVGYAVDRAHRELEQLRSRLPGLSRHPDLLDRVTKLRDHWREFWANSWSLDFQALGQREGFLPPAALQQRTLFDEVVRPLATGGGTTAYFMVDALRYEMAVALREGLGDTSGATTRLEARFAELPTVTSVGMNALTPVAERGRLTPVFRKGRIQGFHTGQFQVCAPPDRKRAIWDRVGGTTCPWLPLRQVLQDDTATLRDRIKSANLVVVHSLEIDDAGEKGVGLSEFEPTLRKLRAAIGALREAGVSSFVITADHGFLLSGESEGPPRQSRGRIVDNKRRHVLVDHELDEAGSSCVSLAKLGYQGTEQHVLFPSTTAIYDQGNKEMSFVHGGNSLQERVIPVLTIVHRRRSGGRTESWRLHAEAMQAVDGLHALRCRVELASQGGLAFGGPPELELALRSLDDDVRVEVLRAEGKARLLGASAMVGIAQDVVLFFRLRGPDRDVSLELFHPGTSRVDPVRPSTTFPVITHRAPEAPVDSGTDWLEALPTGGVRQIFEHLAAHGTVTESEAIAMLGNARKARRFARTFDDHVALVPFDVRIDVIGGVKRYVKQQGSE